MTACSENICKEIRKQIFIVAQRGGLAHLAYSFSCVEILYTLYMKDILKYDLANPEDLSRDRIILSKGHGGLALYSVMVRCGLLPAERLQGFLVEEIGLGGEPCRRDSEWIEASTGSLGHGLPMGVGMALAQKMDQNGAKTYVVMGDGECEEGTIWEAAMAAATFHLDNLVTIIDCNNLQKMASVVETIGDNNWKQRFESFGWAVTEVDGHSVEELEVAFRTENTTNKPLLIIAHTIKGKGVSIMENNPIWHFKLPNKKERKVFQEELEVTNEELEN